MRSHSSHSHTHGHRRGRGLRRERDVPRGSREEAPVEDGSAVATVDLQDLVQFLATRLADRPDEVRVTVQEGPQTLYELRVASEDQGRIIGREGRTIQALRVLVGAAARRRGGRATVELLEG